MAESETGRQGRRRGAHFAQSEQAAAPVAPAPREESAPAVQTFERVAPEDIPMMPMMTPADEAYKRPRRSPLKRLLLVLLILAICAVAGLFAWTKVLGNELPAFLTHLPFEISLPGSTPKMALTVNGKEVKVEEGATLQEVFDQVKPDVKAGNLLSISGNVLGEGQGTAYSATVDGDPVPVDNASKTVLKGGEEVSFSDGIDTEEEFTVETSTSGSPKLVKKVQDGASEGGASIQQGTVQYVYQWGRPATKQTKVGAVSGEKIEGEGTTELQDCIIMAQNIHPDNGEKLVALTFDDGPVGDYTSQYLEILAKYDVKATFNFIGSQIDDMADVAKQVADQGHQVCSHAWDHPDLPTLAAADIKTQLDNTFAKIKEVTGVDSSTLRAPYGDMDINVWLASGGNLTCSVYWTHDSEDWKLPGVDAIVSNCTTNMEPGSVILMHDGGGDRSQDIEALPRIIEAWQAEGYRFVTVAELMASDSTIPEGAGENYVAMPEGAVWPTELGEVQTGTTSTETTTEKTENTEAAATTATTATTDTSSNTDSTWTDYSSDTDDTWTDYSSNSDETWTDDTSNTDTTWTDDTSYTDDATSGDATAGEGAADAATNTEGTDSGTATDTSSEGTEYGTDVAQEE